MSCESFKYFNELIETYCTQHDIDLKSFIENKNNGTDNKTLKSNQNLQYDDQQKETSYGFAKSSESFTEISSQVFSSDFQPEGYTSFERNSCQNSGNLDMPSTSNLSSVGLDSSSSQYVTAQTTVTNDLKKLLRSQRPLESMGFYQLIELAGIVPEEAIVAFQHEQRKYLEGNLEREARKGSNRAEKKTIRRRVRIQLFLILSLRRSFQPTLLKIS